MSKALKDMHEAARDLFEVGAMDAITMKAMDELCLPSMREFSQEEVKSVRRKAKMSQPVFAVLLGVTSSAVAQWERGAKKPSGAAQRLLDIIDRKGVEALL